MSFCFDTVDSLFRRGEVDLLRFFVNLPPAAVAAIFLDNWRDADLKGELFSEMGVTLRLVVALESLNKRWLPLASIIFLLLAITMLGILDEKYGFEWRGVSTSSCWLWFNMLNIFSSSISLGWWLLSPLTRTMAALGVVWGDKPATIPEFDVRRTVCHSDDSLLVRLLWWSWIVCSSGILTILSSICLLKRLNIRFFCFLDKPSTDPANLPP